MDEEAREYTVEDAKAALNRDFSQRIEAATIGLRSLLGQYRLKIVVRPIITEDGRISATIGFDEAD